MPDKDDINYPLFFNLLFMRGLNNRRIKYKDYNANGELEEKELKIKGYIYFQRPRVWPPELQGLLIRVRNVAVGQHDSTFLTYRRHEGFKFSQITGEVYIDGLDKELNIDRSSFRETEPAFVAFRDNLHNYLSKTVFPRIKEFAKYEREERDLEDLKKEIKLLKQNFMALDRKKRKIYFEVDQKKLIERDEKKISVASPINGKYLKSNKEFYRIVAFLEARLSFKLTDIERDTLYRELVNWLNNF